MATFPVSTEIEYDRSTGYDVSLRGLAVSFGDGYRQTARDGINPERQTWRVVTVDLNPTNFTLVRDFLRTNAGLQFDWIPPLETRSIKVTCNGYRVRHVGGSTHKRISAEFVGQVIG